MRYNSADDKPLENAKLVTSFDVQGNCSGETCAQKLHQCQHGGRCVDLVIKTECNCSGTGFYGQYCEWPGKFTGDFSSSVNAYFFVQVPTGHSKSALDLGRSSGILNTSTGRKTGGIKYNIRFHNGMCCKIETNCNDHSLPREY